MSFDIVMNKYLQKELKYVSVLRRIPYFIEQRILRVNGNVPWPVHWSSIATYPRNIKRKDFQPYPGFMLGQYIQALNGIELGKNVRLGPGLKLIYSNHFLNDYSKHEKAGTIVIGDNCWLAADVIVLPGVTLGNHVIVAAGAVVTKSFEENVLIGGNPAKIIKTLEPYIGNEDKW